MNNLAIVSACSDKYFHLFLELLHSIKKNVELKKIDICLIDNGLNEKNLSYNKKKVQIISPVIKFIKNSPVDPFEYVQLFLPKYFPNYKKYIWIDADCWLNSGSAIKMLIEASNKGYFAISSMGDRDCPGAMIRIDWLFRNMGIVKSQNIKHSFKLGLSTKEARYLGLKPHLNAGVFALDKKSNSFVIALFHLSGMLLFASFNNCLSLDAVKGASGSIAAVAFCIRLLN